MARLYLLLFIAQILLAIIALISCLSAEEGEIRALPRIVWVIVILLFPLVGAIAYLVAGRPQTVGGRSDQWRPGGGFPEPTRPPRSQAPDDDPEFLRGIDARTAREDAELLRQWEEDLKRREDDLRKPDKSKDESPGTDS